MNRRGFVRLPGRLDPGTVARLREDLRAAFGEGADRADHGLVRLNLRTERAAFAGVLEAGGPAAAARAALGVDEVVLFQDHLVWKPPGTTAPIEWHQDASYWPLRPATGVTLWIAMDDADPGNGALRYLPGTHAEGERRPADFVRGAGQPQAGDLPPLDVTGREHEAVDVPVRAGEVLAHHPLVWHMSPPNLSARHRRAWSLTFVTPGARWAPSKAAHPYLHALAPREGEPLAGPLFPRFRA